MVEMSSQQRMTFTYSLIQQWEDGEWKAAEKNRLHDLMIENDIESCVHGHFVPIEETVACHDPHGHEKHCDELAMYIYCHLCYKYRTTKNEICRMTEREMLSHEAIRMAEQAAKPDAAIDTIHEINFELRRMCLQNRVRPDKVIGLESMTAGSVANAVARTKQMAELLKV